MFPFIVGGRDCVVLQKVVCIQEGDIVLAHLEGKRYVLHRIYYMNKDEIVLMVTEMCVAENDVTRRMYVASCRKSYATDGSFPAIP